MRVVLPFISQVLGHCGKVDDIISCIGFSWWQKGLLKDQSRQELESTLNSLVVAPFVAFKTFIPLVIDNSQGTFTFVTGILFALSSVLSSLWYNKMVDSLSTPLPTIPLPTIPLPTIPLPQYVYRQFPYTISFNSISLT